MHDTWQILRVVWSAVIIAYCGLSFFADRRLHGAAKKRNRNILFAIAILVAIRFAVRFAFGGVAYRFAVLFVGVVAGIAALVVAQMLITQKPGGNGGNEDEPAVADDRESRIQSLKLG